MCIITPSSHDYSPLATPAASPTPAGWILANLPALGNIPEEGVWQPFLHDAHGRVLAFRTFLPPDPERPYATVALVAFHLPDVRLHYVTAGSRRGVFAKTLPYGSGKFL